MITGSPALAAESARSLADTANDPLLFVAHRRSSRPPDDHIPWGTGGRPTPGTDRGVWRVHRRSCILTAKGSRMKREAEEIYRIGIVPVIMTFVQAGAGVVKVVLLAPVWMQITHLFIADSLWVVLVLLTAEVIAFGPAKAYADLTNANYSPGVRPAASSSSAPANR